MIYILLGMAVVYGISFIYHCKYFIYIGEHDKIIQDNNRLGLENFTLRDVLRESNAELFKHRQLIAGLRTGQKEVTEAVERALSLKE